MRVLLIKAPADYYNIIQLNISDQVCRKKEVPDFIHLFVKSLSEFETEMKKLKNIINQNPSIIIWISWYKKAAKIPTDITEDVIRNYALKNDLVDVKVCAVDAKWSGLKLVVPLAKR